MIILIGGGEKVGEGRKRRHIVGRIIQL